MPAILDDLVGLFEQSSANGTSIRAVVGADSVELPRRAFDASGAPIPARELAALRKEPKEAGGGTDGGNAGNGNGGGKEAGPGEAGAKGGNAARCGLAISSRSIHSGRNAD